MLKIPKSNGVKILAKTTPVANVIKVDIIVPTPFQNSPLLIFLFTLSSFTTFKIIFN